MKAGCANASPGVAIYPFTPYHIEGALELWSEMEGIGLSAADEPGALADFLVKNDGLSYVVVDDDGSVAGTVLVGCDGRRGYVYHLAVRKDQQRRGLGKMLLDAAAKALRDRNIGKVHLFVKASNGSARSFYEHLGWTLRNDIIVFSLDVL